MVYKINDFSLKLDRDYRRIESVELSSHWVIELLLQIGLGFALILSLTFCIAYIIDRGRDMTGKSRDGNFDKTPPVGVEEYDSAIRSFCGAYEEIFKLSYCCLKASLPKRARVLVVGAGTGMEITEFAPLSPDWSFHGVDPSAKMLSLARKKISEKKIRNKIRLMQGYVDDLD